MTETPKRHVSCTLYHNRHTTVKNWYFWPSITIYTQNKQGSDILFSTLENVSGREIHTRMLTLCGTENVVTKSTLNRWIQIFKAGQTNTSNKPESSSLLKRRTQCGMPQAATNSKNASLGMGGEDRHLPLQTFLDKIQ